MWAVAGPRAAGPGGARWLQTKGTCCYMQQLSKRRVSIDSRPRSTPEEGHKYRPHVTCVMAAAVGLGGALRSSCCPPVGRGAAPRRLRPVDLLLSRGRARRLSLGPRAPPKRGAVSRPLLRPNAIAQPPTVRIERGVFRRKRQKAAEMTRSSPSLLPFPPAIGGSALFLGGLVACGPARASRSAPRSAAERAALRHSAQPGAPCALRGPSGGARAGSGAGGAQPRGTPSTEGVGVGTCVSPTDGPGAIGLRGNVDRLLGGAHATRGVGQGMRAELTWSVPR